jgi:3-(3-hydroxy-phenyl)propionate hydroxylase
MMLLPGEIAIEMTTDASIRSLVAPWFTDPSVDVTFERRATYSFHGLVAESWRTGRVFLAGDAAHQMPPFLGQGMNSGIRDAVNLAWKIEHALHNPRLSILSGTYEAERKPHVTSIVQRSVEIGRIVCDLDPQSARDRDRLFLADPDAAQRELGFSLPALGPAGFIGTQGGGYFPQPSVDGGIRFDEYWRGQFLLLARGPDDLKLPGNSWIARFARTVTPSSVPHFADSLREILDRYETNLILVRPDRVVLSTGSTMNEMVENVSSVIRRLESEVAA